MSSERLRQTPLVDPKPRQLPETVTSPRDEKIAAGKELIRGNIIEILNICEDTGISPAMVLEMFAQQTNEFFSNPELSLPNTTISSIPQSEITPQEVRRDVFIATKIFSGTPGTNEGRAIYSNRLADIFAAANSADELPPHLRELVNAWREENNPYGNLTMQEMAAEARKQYFQRQPRLTS